MIRPALACTAALLLASCGTPAPEPMGPTPTDTATLSEHIRVLSSDEFGGRGIDRLRLWYRRNFTRSHAGKRVLVIGSDDHAADFARLMSGRGFRRSHLSRAIAAWKATKKSRP